MSADEDWMIFICFDDSLIRIYPDSVQRYRQGIEKRIYAGYEHLKTLAERFGPSKPRGSAQYVLFRFIAGVAPAEAKARRDEAAKMVSVCFSFDLGVIGCVAMCIFSVDKFVLRGYCVHFLGREARCC